MQKEARESAPVRVLLTSRHIPTIESLCHHTRDLSIHVETACDMASAMRRLCHAKFEGLIVDFELGNEGVQLLGNLPGLTSNRRAISFAIVDDMNQSTAASLAHATFVLQRPFSETAITQTFRAARSMMFRERRRDYRYPIDVRTFVGSNESEHLGSSVNISETGIALKCAVDLKVGSLVHLRIELPQMLDPLAVSGEVCWSNGDGNCGIHFVEISPKTLGRLQGWLSERMSELVPDW
jgi:PilZ domain